jgi:hypothetical protein
MAVMDWAKPFHWPSGAGSGKLAAHMGERE